MANNTTQRTIENLQNDVDKIQAILSEHGADTGGSNGTSVINMPEIKEMAHNAGVTVRHFLDDKKVKLGETKDKCEDAIHSRPFVSTAAAFAGGLLVASLLRRTRR